MEFLNENIVNFLKENNQTISFMESCTGGFLASEITNVSGASSVLKVSLVTYSNEFKMKFGVTKTTIDKYTVYSKETAMEMAKNVSDFAASDFGIGVTGELGNSSKEANTVYFCIYEKDKDNYVCKNLNVEPNKREQMKQEVSKIILEELWNLLTKN